MTYKSFNLGLVQQEILKRRVFIIEQSLLNWVKNLIKEFKWFKAFEQIDQNLSEQNQETNTIQQQLLQLEWCIKQQIIKNH